MRNRQMWFAAVNRIYILLYAPLSAALAIFYLFTANLTDAVLSLLTIPCILLPFAAQKLLKLRRSQLLLFFYLLFLTLYYSGELVVRIPQRFSAYSVLTHLYSGMFFAIIGIITFSMLQKERPKNHDILFCNIFSLSMAVASNAVLELEYFGANLCIGTCDSDFYHCCQFGGMYCRRSAAVYPIFFEPLTRNTYICALCSGRFYGIEHPDFY